MHNNNEKLEFNKVLDVLATYCITNIGKNLAKSLHPENQKDVVSLLLKETTEATSLIYKKHNPLFVEIVDFGYIEKMLKSGSSLNTKNLLEVAQILKLASNLKTYFLDDNEDCENAFPILNEYFSTLYINPSIR